MARKDERLYHIWQSMKQRCYNPNQLKYPNYGERGIKICNEWKNDFLAFKEWSLQNGYEDNLTIDRIDVDKNYESSNCRWADWETQENNRTNNVYIEYQGQKKTAREWGNILGIDRRILYDRIFKSKWDVDKAFNQAIREEKIITFKGDTHTLKEWSDILNINHDTLYSRIYVDNWDIDKALLTPTNLQEKLIEYNGETLNIQQWSDKMGFPHYIIQNRLKRGWSIERAINTPIQKKDKVYLQYTISGEYLGKFDTLQEVANTLGIKSASHIINVCQGNRKTSYGYKWKYFNENYKEENE